MSLNIRIRTIDHNKQRYDTVGDWRYTSGENLVITVSNMGDWRKEVLVAIHELTEVVLCRHRNITQESVDKFDMDFEAKRLKGDLSEPGDSSLAPYNKEHKFATILERAIAIELGVDWIDYEKTINSL